MWCGRGPEQIVLHRPKVSPGSASVTGVDSVRRTICDKALQNARIHVRPVAVLEPKDCSGSPILGVAVNFGVPEAFHCVVDK